MVRIAGVYVKLSTGAGTYTGTDDHVYIGIAGTAGGREFALGVRGVDDFEPNSTIMYQFGPASSALGQREPTTAADQLSDIDIDLDSVTHVYLRKQGDRTTEGDDFWELTDCEVSLAPEDDPSIPDQTSRTFESTGTARLGNQYGHTVWLED